MAFYAVGDIHGCFDEFQLLLDTIKFNPESDILWLVGDLVNRGPKSLEMLRFAKAHQNSVHMVLGNHELHLLAAAFGGKIKKKVEEGVSDVLNAPDKDELLHWLRMQPLLRQHGDNILVHAAIYPEWTIEEAKAYAHELESCIQGKNYTDFFENMYSNAPNYFSKKLTGIERLRAITNIFTRTRFMTRKNKLDFDYKGTLADAPKKLLPWYKAQDRRNLDCTIIFGHWSALGVYQGDNVICLDSGAIWGGPLSAMNLDTKALFQIANLTRTPMFGD